VTPHRARFRSVPWLLRPPTGDVRYRFHCRAFALAAAIRLTLPDAMDPKWLVPSGAFWLGAAMLALCGAPLGWVLCAVGSLWPLLFLEDQLSQSVFLCLCASTAVGCILGSSRGRARRLTEDFPTAVRWLVVAVYVFAAVHKLNGGYFDTRVSCANEGLVVLFDEMRFQAPKALAGMARKPLWPVLHLMVEGSIPLLLLWRPVVGVLVAGAMHLPLTVIFAPSFAFTMMSGWVCFFRAEQLGQVARAVRRNLVFVLCLGGLGGAMSRVLFFPGRWAEDPEWCIKEALLWIITAAVWTTAPRVLGFATRGANLHSRWSVRVAVPCAVSVVNALTPYAGLQFHHAAAMLSNLRIDQGCWNSLLFPEALRGPDPYVRLERIDFAAGRATEGARAAFMDRLWEPTALRGARARWCRTHPEPLSAELRYRGTTFQVANLCASDGWPLPEPLLPGLRRFQTNLTRTCPQRCGH
jgi:hypothetical protein